MISFCQDLSISYEYHVYENKTIKKTKHKRNGSYISQRTITKGPKLEVVSKNISHNEHQQSKGIQLTGSLNKTSSYLLNSANKNLANSQRFYQSGIRSNNNFVKPRSSNIYQVESVEIRRSQLVENSLPMQFLNSCTNKKICNFFKDQNKYPKLTWNKNVDSINHMNKSANQNSVKQTNSFFDSINNDTNDVLNSPSHFKSSISTKFCNSRSNSHNTDFNQKPINLEIKPFSINSTLKKQSLQQNVSMNDFKRLVINPEVTHSFDTKFNDHLQFGIKNISKSVLYDVRSIQSKQLKSQSNDDESVSIVQQRNFFFQSKPFSQQLTKKSIQKFKIFDKGVISQSKIWKIYKQTQQKQTQKCYSIKQFTQDHEKQYQNQYQNYLVLKQTKQSNFEEQDSRKFVLDLKEVIQNDNQKFYLIKEPFEQTLSQYLVKFSLQGERDQHKALKMLRTKIQSQITQILNYLLSKHLRIKAHQNLQLQDFVICKSKSCFQVIKLHNLLKFEQVKPTNKYDLTQSIHSFKKKQTDNFVEIGSFGFIEEKKSPKKLKTQENQTIQTSQCNQIKIDILCMKIDKLLHV